MDEKPPRVQRRLTVAASLLLGGRLIEAITLHWFHPLSFMLFIGVGGTLVGLGIIVYLVAIVTA